MTDDHLDPIDDLASAHLDGLTDREEAARVASDPALAARVATFAAVRDAVRASTGPIDTARRDATIDAALAALDLPAASDSGTGAPIAELDRRRALRRRVRVASVAAAVAVAAALVPTLLRDRGDNDRTLAAATTTTFPGGGASKEAAPAGPAADTGAAAQTMAGMAAPPVALGPVADLPALAAAARAQLSPPPETTGGVPTTVAPASGTGSVPPDAATQACLDGAQATASAAGEVVLLSGTATLAGRSVAVVVTEAPDGRRTLTATDPAAGCSVVGATEL